MHITCTHPEYPSLTLAIPLSHSTQPEQTAKRSSSLRGDYTIAPPI